MAAHRKARTTDRSRGRGDTPDVTLLRFLDVCAAAITAYLWL
jgi:hypothetical protein